MSGDLAGQAMVVRSTWKSAMACRAVAGARFEGSLKKILKGLEHQNIKMSRKIQFRNDRENHLKWNKGLILCVLLLTVIVKHPVV